MVALVFGGGALAVAAVPHRWSDGEVLSATDLSADLDALDARLTAIEQAAASVPADLVTGSESRPTNIGVNYIIKL